MYEMNKSSIYRFTIYKLKAHNLFKGMRINKQLLLLKWLVKDGD